MSEEIHKYDPHDYEPMPEGEEEAPRFTHTMVIVRWIILGGMTLFAFIMISNYFGLFLWGGTANSATQYHCPMHPTYISNQPGDCPICGMTLVPIDAAGKEIKTADSTGVAAVQQDSLGRSGAKPGQYTCPMHPEVISDTPGKCLKCGMNLEQVPGTVQPGQYTCPMHPEVVSDTPGKCPKCGMNLEQVPGTVQPGQYTCPMHPEVVSDTPGKCPKCGMNLEQVPATAQPGQYTCPMHPEVVSDTPGKCPKCGMNLEQVPAAAQPGQYTCPMHPEVVSDTPGKCPKCGMNLEQVPPDTGSTQQGNNMNGMSGMSMTADNSQYSVRGMGSSPVPGLVPVTIESQRLQLIGVRTGSVGKRSLDGSLRLAGYITPDETRLSNIHVRFSGWVKDLAVNQTGQFVEAGQKLLSVYSQDLFQAENEYIIARKSTERTADDILRDTRHQLRSATRQRLDLLGVPPEEISILDTADSPSLELWVRSPFSGYVLDKTVVIGQFINPDQNLFTIADLSKVWVLADVYERDLENIKIGQTARMTTSAYPGESFEGKISFIYPSVSEQTRTLKIRIEFSNASFRLKPGLYVDIDLADQGDGVLAVPADAVMDGGDRQYAFVVHEGTHFEPRLLKLGRSSDDYFEVLSGLSEGEQVVTSANFLIDSESRLKAAIAGMGGTQPDAHAGHGK